MNTSKKKPAGPSVADQFAFASNIARFKAHGFKNIKHMRLVRDYLVAEMDKVIAAKKAEDSSKKDLAKKAKQSRTDVQSAVCGRWAMVKLCCNDLVEIVGQRRKFLVVKCDTEGFMACGVRLVTTTTGQQWNTDITGPGIQAFSYDDVRKIYIDGEWHDVYTLASGG